MLFRTFILQGDPAAAYAYPLLLPYQMDPGERTGKIINRRSLLGERVLVMPFFSRGRLVLCFAKEQESGLRQLLLHLFIPTFLRNSQSLRNFCVRRSECHSAAISEKAHRADTLPPPHVVATPAKRSWPQCRRTVYLCRATYGAVVNMFVVPCRTA